MNIGFTEMDGLLILKEAAALRYEEVFQVMNMIMQSVLHRKVLIAEI